MLFPGVACFFLAFCAGAATHILNETHVTKQKYKIDRQDVYPFRRRQHAKTPCDLPKLACLVSSFRPPSSHADDHASSAHVTCIALPSLGSPQVQLSLIVVMLPPRLSSSDQLNKTCISKIGIPSCRSYHEHRAGAVPLGMEDPNRVHAPGQSMCNHIPEQHCQA